MVVAIVGSRSLNPDDATIAKHLPKDTTEIVSGGARGVQRIGSCGRNGMRNTG